MIRLDQPRKWDLVSDDILIGGVGTGFEAVINYRVTEGHDEVTGYIMMGGGTGEHAQFQKKVKIGDSAMKLDRIFVEVFEISAKDGSELHKVSLQVLWGNNIIKGYYGYREHIVRQGETLSSISRQHYGETKVSPIVRANADIPDLEKIIYPNQKIRIPIGYS